MQNFFDWFVGRPANKEKPWLIIGKGPTYDLIDEYDTSIFNIISLNHVVRHRKVVLAHMIDFDVPVDCAEAIYKNAEYLVMPWVPHINNVPTDQTLEELTAQNPVLNKLKSENRILWYDFITGGKPKGKYPVICVDYFSSEAVLSLLARSGVNKIRSLGIDGGKTYNTTFADIAATKLLANGQPTFDLQFGAIEKIIIENDLDYVPLNLETVKIYVGSAEEQLIPTRVLEYSIRKHTKLGVEVLPLYKSGMTTPMPKDPPNRPRTPFSFQRFFIPKLNGFKGRAIYLDSDMQVFTDIRKLWTKPFGDADLLAAYESSETGRRPQFSVMLLNCEKLKWDIQELVNKLDSGELDYPKLMYEMRVADNISPVIEREWNSLEHYEEGRTHLLHYTDMIRQPWLFRNNALGHIWVRELVEAIEQGFLPIQEVKEHLRKGNMRPSLVYQIKHKHYDVKKLPVNARRMDRFFVPPHERNAATPKRKLLMNRILVEAALLYFGV